MSLPWPSSYLTKTILKVSFLLHDPSNFFQTASFLYSWDFGDGYVLTPRSPQALARGRGPALPGGVPCTAPPSPAHSQSKRSSGACSVLSSGCMGTGGEPANGQRPLVLKMAL